MSIKSMINSRDVGRFTVQLVDLGLGTRGYGVLFVDAKAPAEKLVEYTKYPEAAFAVFRDVTEAEIEDLMKEAK